MALHEEVVDVDPNAVVVEGKIFGAFEAKTVRRGPLANLHALLGGAPRDEDRPSFLQKIEERVPPRNDLRERPPFELVIALEKLDQTLVESTRHFEPSVVTREEQLEKIKRECTGLPSEFSKALAVWPVSEIQKVSEQLQAAIQSIENLGLVQGF